MLDPFTFIARVVGTTNDGKLLLEAGSDTSVFHLKDGDEFITFTTVMDIFGDRGVTDD